MLEINPLASLTDGRVLVCDSKAAWCKTVCKLRWFSGLRLLYAGTRRQFELHCEQSMMSHSCITA